MHEKVAILVNPKTRGEFCRTKSVEKFPTFQGLKPARLLKFNICLFYQQLK